MESAALADVDAELKRKIASPVSGNSSRLMIQRLTAIDPWTIAAMHQGPPQAVGGLAVLASDKRSKRGKPETLLRLGIHAAHRDGYFILDCSVVAEMTPPGGENMILGATSSGRLPFMMGIDKQKPRCLARSQ
jgi:hypothetical protein